jgi:hypothetical protein
LFQFCILDEVVVICKDDQSKSGYQQKYSQFFEKNASILFATILECNFKNLVIQKSSGIWQLENAKNTFFLPFSPRKQITVVVKLGHRKQYNF